MGAEARASEQVQQFYRVGVLALRALQDRGLGPERFGEASSARWRFFRRELTDSHRLDRLLRDAAVAYPVAFSAREAFALPGLSDDEPFGPRWETPPPSQAGPILRAAQARDRGFERASLCLVWPDASEAAACTAGALFDSGG